MTEQPAEPTDPTVETVDEGVARVAWPAHLHAADLWQAVETVRRAVDEALTGHGRVESHVPADDPTAQRVATWSGLRREGVMRGVGGDRIVYARLESDAPASEPEGFRALLNSFLPRKRAISQLLVRDTGGRVLLCELTYKRDWDLPGGVVEVGESPQLAVGREVTEELGLVLETGRLLLTDWLPPWSGWDDALCLVFDGGVHDPAILEQVVREEREIRAAHWVAPADLALHTREMTARRVTTALANLDGGAAAYVESGGVGPG